MNAPVSRSSLWLVIIGAALVLLLGAFSRFGSAPTAAMAYAPALDSETARTDEPAPERQFSPGLDEIVKLAQSHLDDDVIISYIQNSGRTYTPTADEILYLSHLGLSERVLAAFFKHNKPTTATAPPVETAGANPAFIAPPPFPPISIPPRELPRAKDQLLAYSPPSEDSVSAPDSTLLPADPTAPAPVPVFSPGGFYPYVIAAPRPRLKSLFQHGMAAGAPHFHGPDYAASPGGYWWEAHHSAAHASHDSKSGK